ncbi:MAG: lipopolysaccharide biosynthesis protein [Bacteroidetes bacterium]|nr:lipopolysaccharide biosynthesis protein [Bacteroidota bacterium]
MSTLKTKTLRGLFWSFLDSFGAYFIRFGFSVAIARTLAPSDYGLMGMIIIFIAIGNILSESGFGMALIQKKNTTNSDFSTIFYFNLIVSIVIYGVLFYAASAIADFYKEPVLTDVIRVSALTIVIGALSNIQTVILSKELNFKKQTYISLCSTVVSGTTGVIIAYNGFAIWALVFQTLSGTAVRLILLTLAVKWRPSLVFSWSSFIQLYKYGYKIFLQGATDVVFTKIYFPLIGKTFSTLQLGYYTNATSFSEILVKQTTIAYGRVLFPAIVTIKDDRERLNRSYSTVFKLLSFIMIPISVISIVSAPAFVDFFLTKKWLPAVPYMQLFLIEGFFFSLYMLNQNTFNATGASGLSLKVDIGKKLLTFLSLFIAIGYGIKALILGQIISSFVIFIFSLLVVQSKININMRPLLFEYFKLTMISLFLVFIDYFILQKNIEGSGILLLVKVIILSMAYLLAAYILKIQALNDVMLLLGKYLPKNVQRIITKRFE